MGNNSCSDLHYISYIFVTTLISCLDCAESADSAAFFSLFFHILMPQMKGVLEGSLTFKCAKRYQHLTMPSSASNTISAVERNSFTMLRVTITVLCHRWVDHTRSFSNWMKTSRLLQNEHKTSLCFVLSHHIVVVRYLNGFKSNSVAAAFLFFSSSFMGGATLQSRF